jgi:hypothetical protein
MKLQEAQLKKLVALGYITTFKPSEGRDKDRSPFEKPRARSVQVIAIAKENVSPFHGGKGVPSIESLQSP